MSIFQSYFIKFDKFMSKMVDSDCGLIPEGWKVKKIGEVANIVRGASPRPINEYLSNQGIPWVKISDATSSASKFITETSEYIKLEGMSKSRKVDDGTLILSNSATPGLPMIMQITACVHDGWLIFSNYKDITKEYLYYFLKYNRNNILALSNGSVFRNLKTDILKNYKIIIPPKKLIEDCTVTFINIDEQIKINTLENMKLQKLRDILLPKLMNGEIDLSNISLEE